MNTLLVSKRDSLCHSSGDSDDCLSEDGGRGSGGYPSTMAMAASSSSSINPGRKRRRGIIEKRRRDRINQSLSELKRLVPAAMEKSNSAKLEKAEILQMTVEHLKMVGNGNSRQQYNDPYEAHRIAVDYHLIGFKECAAEVARYLTVEGMDIPEQARVKMVTHLQMFASQKECYAAGSRTYHNTAAAAAAPQQTGNGTPPSGGVLASQQSGATTTWQAPHPTPYTSPAYTPNCYPSGTVDQEGNSKAAMEGSYFGHYTTHSIGAGGFQHSTSATNTPPPNANPPTTLTPSYFSPFTPPTTTAQTSVTSSSYQPSYTAPAKGQQQPPYRPWGAEMASC